jgi:hypothetical protein
MYILSYATDWPGLSVGRPAGALACFVGGFIDMAGLLMPSQEDVISGECLTHPGCYTYTNYVWYQLM